MEISLVKFDESFFQISINWLQDTELLKLIDSNPVDYETSYKWFNSLQDRDNYLIWGISFENKPIGVAGLKNITDNDAEYFGYIGESKFWGLGLGQKILFSIISIAREKGLKRIWLKVLEQNSRAIKSYTKSGFEATHTIDTSIYMQYVL